MKRLTQFLVAMCFTCYIQAQTIPTPPQTDEIIIDNGASGKADPNDRIRYRVTIQNTGGADGTGTQLNIVPDPRTTFVPGSFRSSPLALNDAYACTGNVGINIPTASGLKANDFDDNIALATVTAGTFATTQGGSIVIAADGGFQYTPPAGFTGTDTYIYTLNDGNGVGAGVPATDMATVTFTVSNLIWFIDNSAAAGDGRRSTPFNSLAAFNSGSTAAGDVIYIEHTGTNYTGGIVLQNNERLFGEGHTGAANLAGVLPFTLAPNSLALPAINGTRPVITNASGDGVTLAAGNSLRGFDVGACSDFGIENNGTTSVGNLIVSEVSINNSTGGGFDASHGSGAGMNVVFTGISSSGGVNGINLTNCEGTFTVSGGTITNPTGTGVLVSGGTVIVICAAAITDNTGFAVDVDNHDSNNVTFSGNITSTGTGIRVQNCNGGTKTFSGNAKNINSGANAAVTLSSNTGATINFTGGGLAITTTTGTGFNATGGGTVTVQGTGNTIISTSGTALNVTNITIGASNLTFQSISNNGGTNGIVLNTTGSSGGLMVTGTGGANSGGTIQNTSSHGISLVTTRNTSLNNMNIQSTGGSGINGTGVTNFTFTNGIINNSGNAVGESNIAFNGNSTLLGNSLTGTLTVTNSTLTNAFDCGIHVQGDVGTISDAIITGNTITSTTNTATSKGDGIRLVGTGNASTVFNLTKATISNNTIRNFPSAAGIQVIYGNVNAGGPAGISGTPGSLTDIITITNNTVRGFDATNRFGTHAIAISTNGGNAGQRSQGNFNVSNNGTIAEPIGNCLGTAILIGNNGFATMTATVNNNVIVANNTVGSQGIGGGNGVVLGCPANCETPDLTLTVNNNNITQVDGNCILLVGRGTSGIAKLTIKNNNVASPLAGVRPGIRVDAGNSTSVDDAVCVDISGNTSGGSGGYPGIGIRKQGTNATVNDFGIEGFGGGTCSQAEDFIAGLNPGSVLGTLSFCGGPKRVGGISGDNYVTCNTAPLSQDNVGNN